MFSLARLSSLSPRPRQHQFRLSSSSTHLRGHSRIRTGTRGSTRRRGSTQGRTRLLGSTRKRTDSRRPRPSHHRRVPPMNHQGEESGSTRPSLARHGDGLTLDPGDFGATAAAGEDTLRLTDAGKFGIGPRDMVLRRSLGGVRVQHGAARCGQDCGHLVVAWRSA